MDLSVLFNIFETVLKCPECGNDMNSHLDLKKKSGYAHYILLQCTNMECEWKYSFSTSKKHGRSYELNTRSVLAFKEIGRGHTAMTTFN